MYYHLPLMLKNGISVRPFAHWLFAIGAIFLPFTACAAINICVENRDNAPYIRTDHSGLLNRLVTDAASQIHQRVTFHPLPWKRCLTMVEQGAMDAALALVWNAERQARFSYPLTQDGNVDTSLRVWQGEYLIMVPHNSALEWDGQQFRQLTGGLSSPLGYASGEKLRKLNAFGIDKTPDQGLLLVSRGRLPGYVVQKEIGMETLRKYGLTHKVKVLPEPFMTEEWYLVFSPQFLRRSATTAESLWRAIAFERQQVQNQLSAK